MSYEEKSRHEKEAYAQRIMAEMKLKNKKFQERYREVQMDREIAEMKNSSVTTGRNEKRDANKNLVPKVMPEREWDRGKPNPDSEDWEHHDYSRSTRKYPDRRMRRDENRGSRSTFTSNRPTSSFYKKYPSKRNETIPESSMHNNTNQHNRSRIQLPSNAIKNQTTNVSSHHFYSGLKMVENSKMVSNISVTYDESKKESDKHPTEEGIDRLIWHCGSMNEAQHKRSRIENWVQSINSNQGFKDTTDVQNMPEADELQGELKDLNSHQEKSKNYGLSENSSNHKTKERTHFRIKDKSDHKSNQYFSNSRNRGNKISTANKCSSILSLRNKKDGAKIGLNGSLKPNCDSEISDHASSMKESDNLDWEKDKIQAKSISQSSENSRRGQETRVQQTSVEFSGSDGSENIQIDSLKNDEKVINEKNDGTFIEESNFILHSRTQGKNQCKHESKSLSLQHDAVSYKKKLQNYHNPNWEKSNILKKRPEPRFESNTVPNDKKEFEYMKCIENDAINHQNEGNGAELAGMWNSKEKYSKHRTIECKEGTIFLSVTNKIIEDSDSDCQIDTCNEYSSKSYGVAYEAALEDQVSKLEITDFSYRQTSDYLVFDSKDNEKMNYEDPEGLVIEPVTLVNLLPKDIHCEKSQSSVESAKNLFITLKKSKQKKYIYSASQSNKSKMKRNYKQDFLKTWKSLQKSKFSIDKKVNSKSLKNRAKSMKYRNKPNVIYHYTDSDRSNSCSSFNVPSEGKLNEGEKQMIENTKELNYDVNIGAQNLSDDEWSTVTE